MLPLNAHFLVGPLFGLCLKLIVVPLEGIFTTDLGFKSFPGFYLIFFEKETHFERGERGFSCSLEVPIVSVFASCRVVVFKEPLKTDFFVTYQVTFCPILSRFYCCNFCSGVFLRDQMIQFELF